jgi:adenosylcobyric acid synthase
MVQGTASSVGKSLLVAGLCRLFWRWGVDVAPFKAQNMSLNSYVTAGGGEMGRAQVVQAEAAGVAPHVDMNPILLKPEADHRSQVIVLGRRAESLAGRDYYARNADLWEIVRGALDRLRARHALVILEGAGSPAEINLRDAEIVNMRVARYAGAPVLLAGDIDRGGVMAAMVGTLDLLLPEERALVRGLIINKFRGDLSLFQPGVEFLEQRTGLPVLGVVPYLHDLRIAEEDGVTLEEWRARVGVPSGSGASLDIALIKLPHTSNFDEFQPLLAEPAVDLRAVSGPADLGNPDLIILPGSKTTVADLASLRTSGLAAAIGGLARAGTPILGICGGYQMLGRALRDPHGIEAAPGDYPGLDLLPVTTEFSVEKFTHQVTARVAYGGGLLGEVPPVDLTGYEIHLGESVGDGAPPALAVRRLGAAASHPDGAIAGGGWIAGLYVHGLFENDAFRAGIIRALAARRGLALDAATAWTPDTEYDRLADALEASLDTNRLREIVGL